MYGTTWLLRVVVAIISRAVAAAGMFHGVAGIVPHVPNFAEYLALIIPDASLAIR